MDDKMTTRPNDKKFAGEYAGLGRLLYVVRWSQHLLAIIAEMLILLSFAMSGMDLSLGGSMASIPWLKVIWAAMFALGIDTAFALSWVRVRQHIIRHQWLGLLGNLLLALSMSFIIFEPIAIQLLQQSLNLNFNQAVANLGINIVFLTYARAGVAVFLGAILAITNTADEALPIRDMTRRKQGFAWLRQVAALFQQPAFPTPSTVREERRILEPPAELPVIRKDDIAEQETILLPMVEVAAQPPVLTEEVPLKQVATPEHPVEEPAQPVLLNDDTPEQRAERVSEIDLTNLSTPERVAKVLELFPDVSDRELGKLSGMAAATAKKHRAVKGVMNNG